LPSLVKTRVLVVDDEHPLADLLCTILNLAGFEVKVAYNGLDAIATARSFVPDFVITDFSMPPGINGMEAAEQIKRMLPGCRILLLSGQHLEGEFIRYESRGYKFRLLTKPVHPEELLRIIREDDVAKSVENPPCVLNVDDVEEHRYSISRLFSRAGFKVIEAGTGRDAIRKAKEAKPDLILMDVNLPDMNGFTACSQIRSDPETSVHHHRAHHRVLNRRQRSNALRASGRRWIPALPDYARTAGTPRARVAATAISAKEERVIHCGGGCDPVPAVESGMLTVGGSAPGFA
jgi:CheY-like chemotaxis protein